MDKELNPVRVPMDFPHKVLLRWSLGVLFASAALLFCVSLLDPDGGAYILLCVAAMLGLLVLPLCYNLVLHPEGIQVRLFRRTIQQIPREKIKLFCGVGQESALNLCISTWDFEELAQRREEILRKGVFSRQDLLFFKKRPGWQERFVREYLLAPKWNLFQLHTHSPMVWLPFDPVVVIFLRRMYPQIPYLDLRVTPPGNYFTQPVDQIPFYTQYYRADEEGIHILKGKQEVHCFPGDKIKTIFRIDRFRPGSKYEPAYGCYLVASQLTVEELAARGCGKCWSMWKARVIDELPEAAQMYAAEFHFSGLFTWNPHKDVDCHIRYTPEAETLLRQLYPHAQWVDYSHLWR